jgi:hypothetical protein
LGAERADHAISQSRQGCGCINLRQADLDVFQSDAPAPGYVRFVVHAGKQLAEPFAERLFQALDLSGASGNDAAGLRVTLDFLVKIINECDRAGKDDSAGRDYTLLVGRRPSDIPL